jgi:hypothetical protein
LPDLGLVEVSVVGVKSASVKALDYKIISISKARLRAKPKLTNESVALSLGRFAIIGVDFCNAFRRKARTEISDLKARIVEGRTGDNELLVRGSSLDHCVVSIARVFSDNSENLVGVKLIAKDVENVGEAIFLDSERDAFIFYARLANRVRFFQSDHAADES